MPRARYLSRHKADWAIAAVLVVLMFAAEWFRHTTFRSTNYDLAIFEQSVWKMAHGHGATSSLVGWNIFADHLSPVLALFVPFYRLAATPMWFFAAQALALGLGVVCVRPLADAVGLDKRWQAIALVVAYAANPALWNAVLYDFHPLTLAAPVLLFACTAALRNDHKRMWIGLGLMVLLRDDLTVAAAAIALVGWKGDDAHGRRARLWIAGAGIAWMLVGAQLGSAMGSDRYFADRYGYIGATPGAGLSNPVHTFVSVMQHVLRPDSAGFVIAMLLPFALLPLLSPGWFGLAVFLMLPNLASADTHLQSIAYQYGAPLMPMVLLAAAGGLKRLPALNTARVPLFTGGFAAAALAMFGPPSTHSMTVVRLDPADARAAIATLRPTDAVAASAYLGAHVADRLTLLPFPSPFEDIRHDYPVDPSVLDTSTKAQDRVNVALVTTSDAVYSPQAKHFLETAEERGFTVEHFGTVSVIRKPIVTTED